MMLIHVFTGEKEFLAEVENFQRTTEAISADPRKICKVIRRITPGGPGKPAVQDFIIFPLENPLEKELGQLVYEGDFVFVNVSAVGVLNPDGPFARLYYRQMGKIVMPAPEQKTKYGRKS